MLAILKKVLDKSLPKHEINHIFRDTENLVLTDKYFLLVINHEIVGITNNLLFINDKAKYKYNNLKYDNINSSNYISDENFTYPNYKRILLKDINKIDISINGLNINEAINYIQCRNYYGVDYKLMKKFELLKSKTGFDIKVNSYSYRSAEVPLALYGTVNGLLFELIIMPSYYA